MRAIPVLLVLMSTLFTYGFSARVLVMFIAPMKSHKFALMPILEELAQRGHQITVVSPYKSPKEVQNIHDIVLNEIDELAEEVNVDWFAMPKAGPFQSFFMLQILLDNFAKG